MFSWFCGLCLFMVIHVFCGFSIFVVVFLLFSSLWGFTSVRGV